MQIFEKIYKNIQWLILSVSLVAYLFLKTLQADGNIQLLLRDWRTYIDIIFSVYITFITISIGADKGLADGLESDLFKKANEANNEIIKPAKNQIKELIKYVDETNRSEKELVQTEFLGALGKNYEELTRRERRKYHKLKYIKYSINGFTLPVYVEFNNKNNVVDTNVAYNHNLGKSQKMLFKTIQAVIVSTIVVGVKFAFENLGDAFFSLLVIGAGAMVSMLFALYRPYIYLTKKVPAKVDVKQTIWDGFLASKK